MKYLTIILLILSGCCTSEIQSVQTADTIRVNPVKIEFAGTGQMEPVWVNDTVRVKDTVVTRPKIGAITATKDTTVTTPDGTASLNLAYKWPSNKWNVGVIVKPKDIPPGTEVNAVVKIPEKSWKEIYFWWFTLPLLFLSICLYLILYLILRK